MASADVAVYAFDAQGAIRATARQLVGMDLRVVGERLRGSGFKLFVGLDLGPGEYQLRALVRNTISDRCGIVVAPPTVRDGEAPAPRPSPVSSSSRRAATGCWCAQTGSGAVSSLHFTIE